MTPSLSAPVAIAPCLSGTAREALVPLSGPPHRDQGEEEGLDASGREGGGDCWMQEGERDLGGKEGKGGCMREGQRVRGRVLQGERDK